MSISKLWNYYFYLSTQSKYFFHHWVVVGIVVVVVVVVPKSWMELIEFNLIYEEKTEIKVVKKN